MAKPLYHLKCVRKTDIHTMKMFDGNQTIGDPSNTKLNPPIWSPGSAVHNLSMSVANTSPSHSPNHAIASQWSQEPSNRNRIESVILKIHPLLGFRWLFRWAYFHIFSYCSYSNVMFNIHRYICYTCMEVSKWVVNLIHPKFKLETVLKFNSLLSALRWHCHISVNKKRPKATALKKKNVWVPQGRSQNLRNCTTVLSDPMSFKGDFLCLFYASFLEGLEESLPRLLAWPKHGILWVVQAFQAFQHATDSLLADTGFWGFFLLHFSGLNSHSFTFQAL